MERLKSYCVYVRNKASLYASAALRAALYAASKAAIHLFIYMYKRPALGVQQLVSLEIRRQVRGNMIWWMRANGVVHCDGCLNTRGTLRRQEDGAYKCERCLAAQPLVKP